MNNLSVQVGIRWLVFILLQVLLLKRMELFGGVLQHMSILFYPLFIMLLPLRLSTVTVMTIGFFTGLIVDIFYDSIGVHASACVFLGFIRPFAFSVLSPREGYNVNLSPTLNQFGIGWFIRCSSILLSLFLFFYFSVEAFTFVKILDILAKTIVSFFATMIFIMVYMMIFNPRE